MPRGTRADHYLSIAAFYGLTLVEDIRNPHVPDFAIHHTARRAAHFALMGARLREKGQPRRYRPVVQAAAPASPKFHVREPRIS
jgi:hypothetical protein